MIGDEYVDNDVSAFKSRRRPEYERMLADLEAGDRDAVIVYNMDRLTRQPMQLEQFVTLCERAGVQQVATVTSGIDLGNDDGLFIARLLAAFAAKESARKSERIKRKAVQPQLSGSHVLDGLVGAGAELRGNWEQLNLDRQAAIIGAVLDYARIPPGTPGARVLDPSRVVPTWRL